MSDHLAFCLAAARSRTSISPMLRAPLTRCTRLIALFTAITGVHAPHSNCHRPSARAAGGRNARALKTASARKNCASKLRMQTRYVQCSVKYSVSLLCAELSSQFTAQYKVSLIIYTCYILHYSISKSMSMETPTSCAPANELSKNIANIQVFVRVLLVSKLTASTAKRRFRAWTSKHFF